MPCESWKYGESRRIWTAGSINGGLGMADLHQTQNHVSHITPGDQWVLTLGEHRRKALEQKQSVRAAVQVVG